MWSSKTTLRHLVELTKLIELPLMVNAWKRPTDFFLEINMTSLFLGWRTIVCRSPAPVCRALNRGPYISYSYDNVTALVVSFAPQRSIIGIHLDSRIFNCRDGICEIVGPKTDPCGTPLVTLARPELPAPTTAY